MGQKLISRSRLLDAIGARPERHWLVEAGGGFGKTVLASQLRSFVVDSFVVVWSALGTHSENDFVTALSSAFVNARFDTVGELISTAGPSPVDLTATLREAGSVVIVLDGAEEWNGEAQALLADTIAACPPEARFVVMTRSLSEPLRGLLNHPEVTHLRSEDLAFTAGEVGQLIDARAPELAGASEVLSEVTGGWPVAVQVLCERLQQAPDWSAELSVLGSTSEPAADVLDRYLRDLSAEDQAMMQTLAGLPAFDEALVAAGGAPDLIERLVASGLPLAQRFDQRWEFCGPVRDLLLNHQAERPAIIPALVRHLVAEREIKTALDYCLAGGAHELAAEVIASLQIRDDILLDLPTLNRAMSTIGDAAKAKPRSLLVQARANLSAMQFDPGIATLEAAERAFEALDPDLVDPDHLETKMDLALQYAFMERMAEAEERIQTCETAIGPEPSIARAIMLEARSVSSLFDQSDEARRQCEAWLTEAIAIWREVGEARGAISATMNLVSNVLLSQARYADALRALDAVSELRPVSIMNRARTSLFRGMILPFLGRSAEAREELERSIRLSESIGQNWQAGWAWWKIASLHALAGDDAALADALATGEALAGDAVHHPMWVVLHSGAVEDWLRSPSPTKADHARDHVEALEELTDKTGWTPTYLRWLIEARCGDAGEASRAAAEMLQRPEVSKDCRWLIELYTAYAFHRLGDAESAKQWHQQAVESTRSLGLEAIIELLERELHNALSAPDAEDALDPAPVTSVVEVTLFDGFRVDVNGQQLELPSGHVSNVIKVLALEARPTHAEVIIDRLWPEADVSTGRKRLRNVLLRARNAGASFITREADMLTLAPTVGCDLWRAQTAAKTALEAEPSSAVCTSALALYGQALLAEDRYEDWAEDARQEARLQQIALLDRSAGADIDDDDIDAAVAALRRASELDPLPNDRLRRCGQLLRDAGRPGAAAQFD